MDSTALRAYLFVVVSSSSSDHHQWMDSTALRASREAHTRTVVRAPPQSASFRRRVSLESAKGT